MNNIPLKGADLQIPPLWEYPWHEAIDANRDEARNLLKLCSEQSILLKGSKSWSATPEAVGWLTLWTRNYQHMQGAVSLLQSEPGVTKCGQVYSLELICRSTFELYMQLLAMYGGGLPQLSGERHDKQGVIHKLNAYVAWCIYQDKELAGEYTKKTRLDLLGEMDLSRDIQQFPQLGEDYRFLWGEDYDASGEDPKNQANRIRNNAIKDRNTYMAWLEHPSLSRWFNKIRSKKWDERPRDFFGLISDKSPSIGKVMNEILTPGLYPIYQRASALAHGSSIDCFLNQHSGHLMPSVAVDEAQVQSTCAHIRRFCHFNSSVIAALQKIVSPYAS